MLLIAYSMMMILSIISITTSIDIIAVFMWKIGHSYLYKLFAKKNELKSVSIIDYVVLYLFSSNITDVKVDLAVVAVIIW